MESVKNLIDKNPIWSLRRPNGDVRARFMRLNRSGAIEGYNHINEASWRIENNDLIFCHSDGHITARSREIIENAAGEICIVMFREDNSHVQAHLLVKLNDLLDVNDLHLPSDVFDYVKLHKAFGGSCRLGESGFSFPNIRTVEIIEVTKQSILKLSEIGIIIDGSFGFGNFIIIDKDMPKLKLTLRFHARSLNVLVLDQQCNLRGDISFEGHENLLVVGAAAEQRDIRVSATFRYDAAALFCGAGGSAGHVNVWIEGPQCSVQIGDDFLISWGVWLRTADSHAIVDLETGSIINHPRSIVIGPHVWVGQDVMVMGGAQIGAGAIVGARAVVTKSLPPCCVAVGAPAKVVRKRASWTRSAHPEPENIKTLQGRKFESD